MSLAQSLACVWCGTGYIYVSGMDERMGSEAPNTQLEARATLLGKFFSLSVADVIKQWMNHIILSVKKRIKVCLPVGVKTLDQ